MERGSRSKRKFFFDQQALARSKPRFNNNNQQRRGGGVGGINNGFQHLPHQLPPPPPPPLQSATVSTSYRILCPDCKAGGVIGKAGSIIKAIRQETGAWVNVHELVMGDEERIIEISDVQHRDPEGRVPQLCPAQEALFMIHERILESDSVFGFGFDGGEGEENFGGARGGRGGRVVTRLVVAKVNVGSVLGKGGKIIEQMRMETKTQIRVLPRDHNLPRCVALTEEVVQVVGHSDGVKRAIAIISSRLRESQLRERGPFQGTPDRFFPRDDYVPNVNNIQHRLDAPPLGQRPLDAPPLGQRPLDAPPFGQRPLDAPPFGQRPLDAPPFGQRPLDAPPFGHQPAVDMTNGRSNSFASLSSSYPFDSGVTSMGKDTQPFHVQDIVFRILCPNDKVDKVMGETDGIVELLRGDVGVDVRVTDLEPEADERIIVVCSDEGPDDELFPAQEALLHIQSRIVDLCSDEDNVITTRLLVPSSEIKCLEGQDGSLSEMRRLTGANIQILPREQLALGTIRDTELVQIIAEITTARDALVELTNRLRSHLFREVSFPKEMPPVPNLGPDHADGMSALEAGSPNRNPDAIYQNLQTAAPSWASKDASASRSGSVDQRESDPHEDASSGLSRLSVPLVTKSTLEVIIPERAASKLVMGKKLAQISELSGASVTLVEDRPDSTQNVIQISGAPEQAEKAQSLLQGFILSIQEDDSS